MMMTTTKMLHARASAAAIAAVMALSSTAAFAQDAQPVTTDPAPKTVTEPAPATTPAPEVTATPTTADSSAAVDDTSAATATKSAAKATTARKAARTATKAASNATKAATVATHAATQSAAIHSAAPTAAAAPVAAAPSAKTAPIVDMSAQPAPAQAAAKPATTNNDAALEMGGGALALLALGAGAFALARRRRHADEVWEEDTVEPTVTEPEAEPVAAASVMTAPRHDPVGAYDPPVRSPNQSAFAWDRAAIREDHVESNDRRPGETWVERAYRGPSSDNPSQSLRKRLKRAAFFDKREREVAANQAAPVDADAGLPESAMAERELELA